MLAQLIEDLAEEAGKYGALQGVAAPLPPPTATALEPARVYLRYAQVSEATAAKEVFHGRTFDDNAISARFSSEMAFVQVHCTGCLEAFKRHSARLSRPGPPSCVISVPPACSLGTYRRLLNSYYRNADFCLRLVAGGGRGVGRRRSAGPGAWPGPDIRSARRHGAIQHGVDAAVYADAAAAGPAGAAGPRFLKFEQWIWYTDESLGVVAFLAVVQEQRTQCALL